MIKKIMIKKIMIQNNHDFEKLHGLINHYQKYEKLDLRKNVIVRLSLNTNEERTMDREHV